MEGGKCLTRKEKRRIRLQITNLLDTHCASCNERLERKNSICISSCPIGQQMQQLSSMLEQEQVVVEETKKKGNWTKEEEFYLWNHRYILTLDQLAERLDRDVKSVYNKLYKLKKKGGIQHVS
jgi:predicted Rossmann fold nucleotide-binding protein DprA/Smf involved in DNA uptake